MVKKKPKRTSSKEGGRDKPVSLLPLSFREALADLLAIKPKPKRDEEEESGQSEENDQSKDID